MDATRRQLLLTALGSVATAAIPWRALRAGRFPLHAAEEATGIVPITTEVPVGVITRYGAVGDGIADDTAAVQKAFAVGAHLGYVRVPVGRFLISSVRIPAGVHLSGEQGAVFQKTGGDALSHAIELIATHGVAIPLSRPAISKSHTLHIAVGHRLPAGTTVTIRDDRRLVPPYGRNQEVNEIVEAGGNSCTVRYPLIANYTENPEIVPHLVPVRGSTVEGLGIDIPPGGKGGGIYLDLAIECTVRSCAITGPEGQAGIHLWQSARCSVLDSHVSHGQSLSTPGCGYGVAVGNACHHVRVVGTKTLLVRENAISLGSRFCSFEHCADESAHDSSYNTHADGNLSCSIVDCTSSRSEGYGIVLGFEGSRAAERGSVARSNLIVDCAKHGVYVGADRGRDNIEPQVVENTIVRPGRSMPGGVAIRVINAIGPRVVGNRVFESTRPPGAISIVNCREALVYANLGVSLAGVPLVSKDATSTGLFYKNHESRLPPPPIGTAAVD